MVRQYYVEQVTALSEQELQTVVPPAFLGNGQIRRFWRGLLDF